jgi:hypothetical protein
VHCASISISKYNQIKGLLQMTDPILSLQDASLSLNGNAGRVDILKDITLNVTKGETLGLIGPSGSGKSSLLMLMGGLEQATSGTITALGQNLTAMDEDGLARFRRDHMGVVFQSFHRWNLPGHLTPLNAHSPSWKLLGSATAPDTIPHNYPGVSSNASPLPAPRPHGLTFCWQMNLPAISTRPMAP